MWSFRESPLVDGDKLICTPGGADATLVALDKTTGKTIWKSKVPEGPTGDRGFLGKSGAAYASVIAIDFEGQRQYVQLTAKTLVGVAAADGKLLWRYDRPANAHGINCSTPVYHDGQVFAASAYGAGGGLVKLSKDGEGGDQGRGGLLHQEDEEPPRRHDRPSTAACTAPTAATGAATSSASTSRPARCCGTSGGAGKGSVALADGRLYYRTEAGTVLLIEPNAKEYVERGRFKQPDRTRQPAWAHPVVANGKLYIRDQDVLLCYDVKAK